MQADLQIYKIQKEKFLLDNLSNEVTSNVNMFAPTMENWILCHGDSNLIITVNSDGFAYFHSQVFLEP